MTALTIEPMRIRPLHPALRLTFPRVVRSELIKARAVPLTWAAAIFGLLFSWVFVGGGAFSRSIEGVVASGENGLVGAETGNIESVMVLFLPMVVGALLSNIDYSSGTIRSTLAVVPKRLLWLGSKILSSIIVVLVISSVTVASTAGLCAVIYGVRGAPNGLTARDLQGFAMLLVTAVFLGLLGLFLGLITRSLAASLTLSFVIVLVLPLAVGLLSGQIPWIVTINPFLPMNAASSLISLSSVAEAGFLDSSLGGFAIFLGWTLAGLLGSAVLLRRRDLPQEARRRSR